VIHPKWILILARLLFLKYRFVWWLFLWQLSHRWSSKQWYFTWPTLSQCFHLTVFVCYERGARSGRGEGEPSWRNLALWNYMGSEKSRIRKDTSFSYLRLVFFFSLTTSSQGLMMGLGRATWTSTSLCKYSLEMGSMISSISPY